MVGWHDQLDGHEFERALGDGDGQGRLACCSPWGRKEVTEQLNHNNDCKMRACITVFFLNWYWYSVKDNSSSCRTIPNIVRLQHHCPPKS